MARYRVRQEDDSLIYVGIDVHLRQWHVTVRTMEQELFSGSIPGSWPALGSVLSRYRPDSVTVAYESGFSGYWLYDRVVAWGGKCQVAPPTLIPSVAGNRVKTDRRDSRKLSWLLSRGMLPSIWVPDLAQRGHRRVLRRRRQLVQDRTRLQSRIKAELALYGLSVGTGPGRWTGRVVAELQLVQFPDGWAQRSYDRLLTMYRLVTEQLVEQTRLLRELAATERYREPLRLLQTVPGIGVITGMALLLELGEISRFTRADALAAYAGLTPSQYSSGDRIRMGRITGMGNRYLRSLLIEAAWVAVRRDSHLRTVYDRLKPRAGGKRAIVAVARRLLLAARRVLLDQTEYRSRAAA